MPSADSRDTSELVAPVQLYLDAQDYSKLSDNPRGKLVQVRKSLKEAVKDGLVVVRFGCATVEEVLPSRVVARKPAARRLDFMWQISSGRCLKHPLRLIRQEIEARDQGVQLAQLGNYAYSDAADWLPEGTTDVDIDADLKTAQEAVDAANASLQIAASDMNRQERRAAGIRKGNLPSVITRHHKIQDAIEKRVPGFSGAARVMREAMFSPNGGAMLQRDFESRIRRLDILSEWCINRPKDLQKLAQVIRSTGHSQAINSAVDRARMEAIGAYKSDVNLSLLREQVAEQVPEWTIRAFERLFDISTTGRLPNNAEFAAQLPTLSAFAKAYFLVWSQTMLTRQMPRKMVDSDMADVYHAAYIPHVDWFRCDKSKAHIFNSLAATYGTEILPTLDDLQNRLLKLRGSKSAVEL
jgi:hypothetical protein